MPQVPLIACLSKFDGSTCQEMMNGDTRQYVITKLPKFLIVHIKRFAKNTQQVPSASRVRVRWRLWVQPCASIWVCTFVGART